MRMEAQVNMAPLLTQPHQKYNRITKQPSLQTARNQVEWKCDNYGIKETTSVQTGRRDRDTEQAGPHIDMRWLKIWEAYLGSEQSQPHTRPPSQGFQCQEDKSQKLLAAETSRD